MGYVAFVLILCAMIVIHEFGHFIVAKMLGISVETFSVGFGPRLLGFRIGETDYRLSAIPLGGYVKFRGENLEMIQGKSEGSIDEFLSHPKWKRLLVAVAGPVFNIVTALLIPTIAILVGFRDSIFTAEQIVVGRVLPGSSAEQAGLQPGDHIVAFGSHKNAKWNDFQLEITLRPNEDLPLTVERNGQTLHPVVKLQARTVGNDQIGTIGIEPYLAGVGVARVQPGTPAAQAGIQAGDKLVAVNGTEITSYQHFKEMLNSSNGQAQVIKVMRNNQPMELSVTPVMQENEYRLGFRPDLTRFVKTSSLITALNYGWDYNWRILRATGVALRQVIFGQRSARNTLGGPVRIAEQTADTYEAAGWMGTIELMGMLSLNLGVFNLLPIPVLDGGVILMILVEALFGLIGLSLTMNVRERVQQVGFVMVLLLMGFVFVNDFVHLGERIFSKPTAQEQSAGPAGTVPSPTPAAPVVPVR